MATLRQILDKKTTIDLQSYGTTEGVEKAWDTRGRHSGKNIGDPSGRWLHSAIIGENRPYHLYEGMGPLGGKWMAKESGGVVKDRDIKVFDNRKDAEDHINNSQD